MMGDRADVPLLQVLLNRCADRGPVKLAAGEGENQLFGIADMEPQVVAVEQAEDPGAAQAGRLLPSTSA